MLPSALFKEPNNNKSDVVFWFVQDSCSKYTFETRVGQCLDQILLLQIQKKLLGSKENLQGNQSKKKKIKR